MKEVKTIFVDYESDAVLLRVEGLINLIPDTQVALGDKSWRVFYSRFYLDDLSLYVYCWKLKH